MIGIGRGPLIFPLIHNGDISRPIPSPIPKIFIPEGYVPFSTGHNYFTFGLPARMPAATLPNGKFPFSSAAATLNVVMNNPSQPNIRLVNAPDYRETYANSVQVRVNVWDFFLVFGTLQQQSETQVEVKNFQGIYLSPQQAKALMSILQQNVSGYESTFGEIKLDPRMATAGPVH